MPQMVSPYKLAAHMERLQAYLDDEPIFPVTLELSLTAACNRRCPDCPSSLGSASMSLDLEYLHRLFGSLEGSTKGLIVTGGEPTLSSIFPKALEAARLRYRFEDVAVVTNGTRLDDPCVSEALVAFASAVRISLYDWDAATLDGLKPTLDRIEKLRARADRAQTGLAIGVSALTAADRAGALERLAARARDAGAHWLYFHPTCTRDLSGRAERLSQQRVLEILSGVREAVVTPGFEIHMLESRYDDSSIEFDAYHAAHFVLVIAADGKNYLATEVKYQPRFMLADPAGDWRDGFLWDPARVAQIRSVSSAAYPAQGTRNRGVVYNTLIHRLKRGTLTPEEFSAQIPPDGFSLPHII